MEKSFDKKKFLKTTLLLASVFFCAAMFFLFAYLNDNKYTSKGVAGANGLLVLSDEDLQQHPVIWLVEGWEFYDNRLLTPKDFENNTPLPDNFVFIGQYVGFENHRFNDFKLGDPHGAATYRLTVMLPEEESGYTLELPEIFSAYKLYINGTLAKTMGETDEQAYKAETGITAMSFQASGRLEIIVAVSDYSHFYSGMVYPPAFGRSSAVVRIINIKLVLRTMACAIALSVGVLYFLIGLLGKIPNKDNKKSPVFLYSFLCVIYTVYTCYPVVKTLYWGGMFLYRLELLAYCAILFLINLIQAKMIEAKPAVFKGVVLTGVAVCVWAIIFPYVMGSNLSIMLLYSKTVNFYTWLTAAYLTVGGLIAAYKNFGGNPLMICGIAVLDCALLMDRVFPLYEPIYGGWFIETACTVLVLLLGVELALYIARQLRMRQAVEARAVRVSKMLEVQQAYYPVLLEKENETRKARHDLRHHVAIIREFLDDNNIAGLKNYLNMQSLQQDKALRPFYCKNYVTNMLLQMYAGMAEKQKVKFNVMATGMPDVLDIDDVDMCVLLSNILENALEAAAYIPVGSANITVHLGHSHGRLIFLVENKFDGVYKKINNKIFSRKEEGREGVGLASVKAIADRYGGSTNFFSEGDVFHSQVFIPQRLELVENEQSHA